jgi:hypothetical protein
MVAWRIHHQSSLRGSGSSARPGLLKITFRGVLGARTIDSLVVRVLVTNRNLFGVILTRAIPGYHLACWNGVAALF